MVNATFRRPHHQAHRLYVPALLLGLIALPTLGPTPGHGLAEAPEASSSDSNSSDSAAPAAAAGPIDPGYLQIRALLSEQRKERKEAARALLERNDPTLAFGIVDALFFIPRLYREDAVEVLQGLTGEEIGAKYWLWVEAMGRLGEKIRPAPGYGHWKLVLFSKIDEGYREILRADAPTTLRLEEVVSGGVPIEGIPSLDDPSMIPAAEARYLDEDESIFGVVHGGEARAYPLRILDWHEMLNDTIAGEPITLSYCTLCGSGVLYKTRRADGEAWRFGTSGLLYRSNKLMFDRETRTLWSNLLGVPVLGELVGSGLELELLPHTRTTWGEWKSRHPDTLVVEIDRKLKKVARKHGFDYQPGAADRARRGVEFPVWKKSRALPPDTEVYALRQGTSTTAYPLDLLFEKGLINDQLGGVPVVLVADADSGAVRAYRRGNEVGELRLGSGPDRLVDDQGREFRLEESKMVGPGDIALERLPGHFAFWFGWYAFHPRTEVYGGQAASAP